MRTVDQPAYVNFAVSSVPAISVVGTPKAGEPFQVAVQTHAPNGCWVRDYTVVDAQANAVFITPFNRTDPMIGAPCTASITRIPHTVTLSFTTPGIKQVTLRGRDLDTQQLVALDIAITVAP